MGCPPPIRAALPGPGVCTSPPAWTINAQAKAAIGTPG